MVQLLWLFPEPHLTARSGGNRLCDYPLCAQKSLKYGQREAKNLVFNYIPDLEYVMQQDEYIATLNTVCVIICNIWKTMYIEFNSPLSMAT